MKKTALIICFVLSIFSFANGQVHKQIEINVPFDFYIQDQKLTAGNYLIQSLSPHTNQTTLVFRDKKGTARGVLTTNLLALNKNRKSFNPAARFNRYGEYYFFAEIDNPAEEFGFRAKKTKTESHLARKFGKPIRQTVAVNSADK